MWIFGGSSASSSSSFNGVEPFGKDSACVGERSNLRPVDADLVHGYDSDDFFVIGVENSSASDSQPESGESDQGAQVDAKAAQAQIDMTKRLHAKELELKDRMLIQKENKIKEQERKLQDVDRSRQTTVSELKNLLQEKSSKVTTLQNEVDSLREEFEQMQCTANRAKDHSAELSRRVEFLLAQDRATSNQHITEITALQNDVCTLEKVLREKEAALLEQKTLMEALREQIKLKQESSSSCCFNDIISACTKTTTEQQPAATSELSALRQQTENLKAESQQLQQNLQKALRQVSNSQTKLQEMTAKYNDSDTYAKGLHILKEKTDREFEWARKHQAAMMKQIQEDSQKKVLEIDALKQQVVTLQEKIAGDHQTSFEEAQKLSLDLEAKDLSLLSMKKELEGARKKSQEHVKELLRLKQKFEQFEKESPISTTTTTTTTTTTAVSANILLKDFPNCIPIFCSRADNCKVYHCMSNPRFCVPKDITLQKSVDHIHDKLGLSSSDDLYVTVKISSSSSSSTTSSSSKKQQKLPSQTAIVQDLYEKFAAPDGFLCVLYSDQPF